MGSFTRRVSWMNKCNLEGLGRDGGMKENKGARPDEKMQKT